MKKLILLTVSVLFLKNQTAYCSRRMPLYVEQENNVFFGSLFVDLTVIILNPEQPDVEINIIPFFYRNNEFYWFLQSSSLENPMENKICLFQWIFDEKTNNTEYILIDNEDEKYEILIEDPYTEVGKQLLRIDFTSNHGVIVNLRDIDNEFDNPFALGRGDMFYGLSYFSTNYLNKKNAVKKIEAIYLSPKTFDFIQSILKKTESSIILSENLEEIIDESCNEQVKTYFQKRSLKNLIHTEFKLLDKYFSMIDLRTENLLIVIKSSEIIE